MATHTHGNWSMQYRMKALLLGVPTAALVIFYLLFFLYPHWFPR
jgi:hypothetical protein